MCHLQLPTVMYPSLPHNPTKMTIPEAVGNQMTTVVEIPKTEDASKPKLQQVPAVPDPTKGLHKGYHLTCPKEPRFWPDPLNNNLFQCSNYFHVSSNATNAPPLVAKLMIYLYQSNYYSYSAAAVVFPLYRSPCAETLSFIYFRLFLHQINIFDFNARITTVS